MSQKPVSRSRLLLDELLELPRLMVKMLLTNVFFAALACMLSVLHHPVYYVILMGGGVLYAGLDGVDWRRSASGDVKVLFSVRLAVTVMWYIATLSGLWWLVGDLLSRNAGEGWLA